MLVSTCSVLHDARKIMDNCIDTQDTAQHSDHVSELYLEIKTVHKTSFVFGVRKTKTNLFNFKSPFSVVKIVVRTVVRVQIPTRSLETFFSSPRTDALEVHSAF